MDEMLESRIEAMLSKLRERRVGPVPEPVATLQAELRAFLARYERPLERVFSESEVRALLSEALEQARPEAAAAVEEGGSLSALSNAFESLNAADSQPAILKYLVGFLSRQYERVAIFMVREREQTAVGWLVRGFARGGDKSSVRKEAISLAGPSILRSVLESRRSVLLEQPARDGLYPLLSIPEPARAAAWPLKLHNRVGVILYGDQVESRRELGYLKELELILPFAEKVLEVLALRSRLAGGAAAAPSREAAAAAPSAPAGVEEAPQAQVAPARVEAAPQEQAEPAAARAAAPGGAPGGADEVTEAAEDEIETPRTGPIERPQPTGTLAPPRFGEPIESTYPYRFGAPAEAAETAPEAELVPPSVTEVPEQETGRIPQLEPESAQYLHEAEPDAAAAEPLPSFAPPEPSLRFEPIMPGAGLEMPSTPTPPAEALEAPAEEAAFAPPAAEELPDPQTRALQEEARKFARLLVYEIKLYNEEKVAEGRLHGDLYGRLKLDIDRSLEVFHDRYPEAGVRATYFDDYLVEILGDGNPDLLGPKI